MLVLEAIPSALGEMITKSLRIPTIGIGAGPNCSGQVLVLPDMLGISPGKPPKFVKDFMADHSSIEAAIKAYVKEVKSGKFPGPEHSFAS
jgi:3-methyl-2-oxobutanoate hydroxymethyltransferase